MAGGLTLIPSYTSDNIFPAYQDRLLIESLGVRAGIIGPEDFTVSAASGLQVEVNKGKVFVEQTKSIEESSNTFYNGLYNVLNPTLQNPYNNVEVPTTNPQIAQIIVRVYDTTELGISGSSYARIEWLNGAANAGATKAHVEAGEALSFGAAALPTSSFKLAYVVVPKNATISSEFEIVNERIFAGPGRIINGRLESGVASPVSKDFKSEKISTGKYKVTFSKAFNIYPIVQLTLEYTGTASRTAYIEPIGGFGSFTLLIREGVTLVDGNIHFTATGRYLTS